MNKQIQRRIFFVIAVSLFIACTHEDEVMNSKPELASSPYIVHIVQSEEISFMHISDTHGSDVSLSKMISLLDSSNCNFAIVTGDILPSPKMIQEINSTHKTVLLLPGNHDAYDIYGQKGFRRNVLDRIQCMSNANFANDSVNYYYQDFTKCGHILRVISLDQYDLDEVGKPSYCYSVVWSQNQINWLIDLLEKSENVDGIILLMHSGYGNSKIGARDINNKNDFISIFAYKFGYSYLHYGLSNPLIIPDIVEAYISGINIINKKYLNGYNSDSIQITTHFTNPHSNFIAHFGGHLHWDEVEYLKDYNQLQVLMAFSGLGDGNNYTDGIYNDLVKENSGGKSYNINLNSISFYDNTLKIVRLGAKKKVDGTTRDSITFPWNKKSYITTDLKNITY